MDLAVYVRGFFYNCDNPDNTNTVVIIGLIAPMINNKQPVIMIACPKCLSFMVSPLSLFNKCTLGTDCIV